MGDPIRGVDAPYNGRAVSIEPMDDPSDGPTWDA
jgi:hypothetical protein